MIADSEEDIAGLKAIGRIVARCLRHMASQMRPGMTTAELDAIGAAYLEERGAVSAPQATYDFPGATCISINEEVAHGVPGERVIKAGDLVNIDVSASLDGYYGDTGGSFPVGEVSDEVERLCQAGRAALAAALNQARAGGQLRHVGRAMERTARRAGFRVVRNLASHGVGRALHEEPAEIPSFDDPTERRTLRRGLVITLEPFVTNGNARIRTADDGWTLLNKRGSRTVQYEHTLIVTSGRPIITTLPG